MKKRYAFITLINLLLTATCCVGATFAWMAINKKVVSNNMTLDIQDVSNITTVSAYALKYDGIYGASCFDIKDGTEIIMTEYDKIFKDRNVNTPLIFRIEISNVSTVPQSYISVKIPCSQQYIKRKDNTSTNSYQAGYTYPVGNSNGYFNDKTQFQIQQYISNVLRITIGAGTNDLTPVPTTESRYEDNVTLFNSQHTILAAETDSNKTKTYSEVTRNVSAKNISFSKVNEIEVSINYSDYAGLLFDGDETVSTKHLILFLMFDYDSNLMETFIETLRDEDNTNFKSDLNTIIIENKGA